uniref:hypothetical protein n=1 Tax=Pararhizobium sp. IMCC3301 TaxID=3067904 RepID=UPI0027408CC7|nr:hypothetical protein [Pararhizobium sp. IMCC3301]
MMRFIQQPGPAVRQRHLVSTTRAVEISIALQAGDTLLSSVAAALEAQGSNSAYLTMSNAAVSQLDFVIPAPSPDVEHAAWWSDTRTLAGPGEVVEAGLVFGRRDGEAFIHCHGAWRDHDGNRSAGHMLPDRCILKNPTTLQGWVFPDARFEGSFDAETNFTLFQPSGTGPATPHDAALVRLRPNVEIGQELEKICCELGWSGAELHGIGSLIGARFDDRRTLQSYATEFLIQRGRIAVNDKDAKTQIDIVIVGLDGEIYQGRLQPDENAVLMTCELVLLRRD